MELHYVCKLCHPTEPPLDAGSTGMHRNLFLFEIMYKELPGLPFWQRKDIKRYNAV